MGMTKVQKKLKFARYSIFCSFEIVVISPVVWLCLGLLDQNDVKKPKFTLFHYLVGWKSCLFGP